ncbi:uncharacterized protein LY89DRAFT_681491 [Mollisia scopiformis]|uniref:Uncharacterized protein n=1 Tax=Mollisia scopiformis TaxID=149040 RepID=A0A194XPM8_MOLSC|nr:uncharacterized protein LY89DRAFT_681491 [Mollisia scopiformis]KUJ22205.1 hypothetical protein LY89DRAFT_681491 [Mollisia scopiformis]
MQPNACSIKKIKDDMTATPQSGEDSEGHRKRNGLPPEVIEIIWPALQVGGLSGLSGLTLGAFAGVMRSSPPALFAMAAGIQWFTLGTTIWASRGFVLHAWGKEKVTPREKISASAIAGAIGGTAGGLLRGRKNVIPGATMVALFGATGQYLYNVADARKTTLAGKPESAKNSWLDSKWSPMKVLSDQDYENMLREKLLRVNAEIALVDDNIEALRAQEQKQKAKGRPDVENPRPAK